MKLFKRFIAIVFACVFLSSCTEQKDAKPNIILMNIDDMGWRDVGFMGSEYYETPNLDALAAEGMIFTQAYASASNCAPSRACMMSGQWTPRHGIYTVNNSDRGKSKNRKLIPTKNNTILGDENYILAEALKDAGYITCHAGKWHLNDDPTTQGFDVNIGGTHAGHPSSYYPPYKNVPLDASEKGEYLTNLIMDKVLEFLDTVGEEPFFLNYSPYAVHGPYHPFRQLLPKYNDKQEWNGQGHAKYATMVENLDTQIGRLIKFMDESGKMDNTLIIFTSDNGGVYKISKQWPLRAGKGSYYEGGIREPMFVYWKGQIVAGSVCDAPVSNLDFYPTLLEIANNGLDSDNQLDGQSLLPLLTGKETSMDRPLFWHFPIYLQGGNEETQDKLFRTRPGSAIRFGNWKLIEYFENNELELYNLTEDVGEKNNLAGSNPEKLDELKKMLDEWRQNVGAPVPDKINSDWEGN